MNDAITQDSALAQDLIEEVVTNPNIFVKWWNSIALGRDFGLIHFKRHNLAFFTVHLFCFKTFIQFTFCTGLSKNRY